MARRVHAERGEDAAVQEAAERLAADLLDDAAEQHEVGVAVEIARSGREIQPALAADAVQQVLRLARLAEVDAAQAHDLQHVADAGGVVHQVRQRDAVAEIGERRKVARTSSSIDSRPSAASSRMAAQVNCLLTEAMRKVVLGADRNAEFDAGHAGALVHDKIAAYHHAERHAWPVGLTPRRKQSLDATAKQQVIEIVHRRH